MPVKIFPAQFEFLDDIREFVAIPARLLGVDEKDIYNLQLAADEAASNIIEHAYVGVTDGTIEVDVQAEPESFTIIMKDHGHRFDAGLAVEPDLSASLEDRAVGGLGLFFMRKLMDVVRFEWVEGTGNILTMIKTFPAPQKKRRKIVSSRTDIFNLGGKMLSAPTFASQRDLIIETISQQIEGQVSVWLNEQAFRLPDWVESLFAPQPETPTQKLAHESAKTIHKSRRGVVYVAVPIQHEAAGLGVIEVKRQNAEKFSRREVEFIEDLCRAASIALIAWHHVSIERWRIGQLGLVRTVSAQIANEPDIDELAQKITRLIQSTFKYYYVGIFTLEHGQEMLTFRSSTGGATRRKGSLSEVFFQVRLGEGLVGKAALTGEEMLANDALNHEDFRQFDGLPETRSELVLPLRVEEQVLGVLDVQSEVLNAFHPYDLLVLRALADSVAVAIEGARRFGDVQQQVERLRMVGEISKQITSILSLHELMQEVAGHISASFGFPYVHLFTVHPNRRQIHYEAGSGARSTALEGFTLNLDNSEGIIPWVARQGETVLVNNVEDEPRYLPSPFAPVNTRSELTVPLTYNGQVLGLLDIQSDQLNAFSEHDRLVMETLGASVAAAIRNADLYRSEQWRRQVGDSLRDVAVLLSANASIDHVLDAILTELERNLPADISAIWLLDEDDIYCAAVHGAKAVDMQYTRDAFPESTTALALALLSRQPLIRRPGDPFGPEALLAGFNRDHSAITLPLRIGEQSVGLLTLVHHTPGRYGHEAKNMVTTFASYAAVAIENARLYDSSQEQAYASAALLQVAQAVASLSDIDDILGTIVRIMPILVGVERAAIYLWHGSSVLLVPAQHYGIPEDLHPLLWRPFRPGEFPLLDGALQREQMVLCQEAHLGPQYWLGFSPCPAEEQPALMFSDDRLLVALPLMLKGEIFGILLVEEATGGRRFRTRRLEILSGVAQQVALAVQNDIFQRQKVNRERLETEVHLARKIQETFIPRSLAMPQGWDLAARWRTALQMGGDFYDVFHLPDGRLGLFIADVADKGMPAALFMALTRTLVRAAVMQTGSPAGALNQVNDLLYPDCEQGMFVTAVYGALDFSSGVFTYANAGHNPPIHLHDGKMDLLSRTGIALGVIESAQMTEHSIYLQPGDVLMFYTDGVTEAFSPLGDIFGEERLKAALLEMDALASEGILNDVDGRISSFVGDNPIQDDITLMVLQRLSTLPEK